MLITVAVRSQPIMLIVPVIRFGGWSWSSGAIAGVGAGSS
jgi:hypothetical protein